MSPRSPLFSTSLVSSSSRARKLDDPLIFAEDYGLVTHWYNIHKRNGPTTIHKMELRKEYAAPAYHEFILILTRAGHTYRVDRGRDGPVLETMMERGVPPLDTIALLQLTSWSDLNRTSWSVVGLRWEGDKTIDLKLILDICFQIHNGSGKRYKLLTHNCYFFAQTIIIIAVRKTVSCKTKLDKVLKRGMCNITWRQCWEATVGEKGVYRLRRVTFLGKAVGETLGRQLGRQLAKVLEQQLGELGSEVGTLLGRHMGWQLGRELERQLGPELRRELEWELEQQKHLESERRRDKEQEQELVRKWELEWRRARDRDRALGLESESRCWNWLWEIWGCIPLRERKWETEMELEREQYRELIQEGQLQQEQERERERRKHWVKERLRLWSQLQEKVGELESSLALELELAHGALMEVLELALNGELRLGWHKKYSKLNTFATRTVEDKLTTMWARWLIDNLGKIVVVKMKEAPLLDDDSAFSKNVEFPPLFSVSCASKINWRSFRLVSMEKYNDLEQYMISVVERHVESVPPALGSREQLKAEILTGMTATWHLLSPQFPT